MDPSSELLSQLEGLDLPAATGLGIAPGWWLLLFAVLLVLAALYFLRRRKTPTPMAPDWRPQAQQELVRIRQSLATTSSDVVLSDCSRLARRIALAVLPREEVASLHGKSWMLKLDKLSQSNAFTEGHGQLLSSGPYQMKPGTVADEADRARLDSLVSELDSLFGVVSGERS